MLFQYAKHFLLIKPYSEPEILVPDPANTKTIETTAETIELKGLKAATTYKVKVAALNGAGAGPLSSPIEELVSN